MVLLENQHSIWQEVPVSEYNVSAEEIPLSPIFVLMGVGCLILFLFKPSGWMKKTECIPSFRHAYFLSRCLVGWQLNSWLCLNALCIELQLDVLLILFLFSKCAETPCTPVYVWFVCVYTNLLLWLVAQTTCPPRTKHAFTQHLLYIYGDRLQFVFGNNPFAVDMFVSKCNYIVRNRQSPSFLMSSEKLKGIKNNLVFN